MIKELLIYLKNKSSKEARAFGHLYESISLLEREKRCKNFWIPHRTQCKNFILKTCEMIESKSSILILGSGPLHEIPLTELAKSFQKVDLVDIVHLAETKNQYKHLSNVQFIEADITELESIILQKRTIINKEPTQFLNKNYDLVVSANLLSQLPYHLRNFLEKKSLNKLSSESLDQFCFQVSLDHYEYLKKFNCPVVLITDIESHFLDKDEKILDKQTPYINFKLPIPKEEWWWNVAPRPELSKEYSLKMKVAAFILNF